mgnify:CR=1 FL=1
MRFASLLSIITICLVLTSSLTKAQEFMVNEHVITALFQNWHQEDYHPNFLAVEFKVSQKDYKWDTDDLVKLEGQIDGFIGSSEAEKIMWTAFMITGSVILTLVYPLIFYNEYKRLVLAKVKDTIDDKLLIA